MPLYSQQLDAGPLHITAAFGAFRTGQLRRDFHAYIEASRAVPWRQWLHYNSWYQLRRPVFVIVTSMTHPLCALFWLTLEDICWVRRP